MSEKIYIECGSSFSQRIDTLVTATILNECLVPHFVSGIFTSGKCDIPLHLTRSIKSSCPSTLYENMQSLGSIDSSCLLSLDQNISLDTVVVWKELGIIPEEVFARIILRLNAHCSSLFSPPSSLRDSRHVSVAFELDTFGDLENFQLHSLKSFVKAVKSYVNDVSSIQLIGVSTDGETAESIGVATQLSGGEHEKYSTLLSVDLLCSAQLVGSQLFVEVREGLQRQLQRASSLESPRLPAVVEELSGLEISQLRSLQSFSIFLDACLRNYRRNRKKIFFRYIDLPERKLEGRTLVVVPYRNREEHLEVLLKKLEDWEISVQVVEQGNDDKFNLGILYNIGVSLNIDSFDRFILHCVDNIPDDCLREYYLANTPEVLHFCNPIHYSKYSCPQFFGGVIAINKTAFERANGFPNNFWGWGGEDVAFYNRIAAADMEVGRPTSGQFNVLGHELPTPETSDLDRHEKVLLDLKSWQSNGLSNLKYNVKTQYRNGPVTHTVVEF